MQNERRTDLFTPEDMKPNPPSRAVGLLLTYALTLNGSGQAYFPRSSKDAYFFHMGDHPNQGTPNWGDNGWAPNGVGNDGTNWFFCAVGRDIYGITDNFDYNIFKIPKSIDIDHDLDGYSAVDKFNLQTSSADTTFKRYGHAGDLDVCVCPLNGQKYVLVPLTSKFQPHSGHPIIGFFKASNLQLVNYAYLDTDEQTNVGWCAVDPSSDLLYSSKNEASHLISYNIDWASILYQPNEHDGLQVEDDEIGLRTEWNTPLTLPNMQGGEFTENGRYLYLSSGIITCDNHHWNYQDGIHVIDAFTGRRIQRSTNTQRAPYEHFCFDFTFHNVDASPLGCWGEEPEGLTIWDLNGEGAPHVQGSLHVIIDDHNFWTTNTTTMRHYDRFHGPADLTVFGSQESGEPASNPDIVDFLTRGTPIPFTPMQIYRGCSYVFHDAPEVFPSGRTRVVFTVTDFESFEIRDTAYVKVINEHDECTTALEVAACDRMVTNNLCAGNSSNAPPFLPYIGPVEDVWLEINPPSDFSIETYQVQGGLTNTVMMLYSGTCGNLTELAYDDSSGVGDHAKIELHDYSGPLPLYVRVTDYGGNDYGEFGLYLRKTKPENDLFSATTYIAGDGAHVLQNPTLPGDVNGDGKTDLIFVGQGWGGNTNLNVRVKMSNGDGTFDEYSQVLGDGSGVMTYPTLTGDVNGDGKTDLIFVGQDWGGNTNLNVRVKMSNGDGTFDEYSQVLGDGSGVMTYPTLTGDVNGDGKTDLIFVGEDWSGCGLNIRVKYSNGDGTWCAGFEALGDGSGVLANPTLRGDLNADGRTDLVFLGMNWSGQGLNIRTKFALPFDCNQQFQDGMPWLDSDYVLFPNPTLNSIAVGTRSATTLSVQIYDQMGNLLLVRDGLNGGEPFDVSDLSPGVYILWILDGQTQTKEARTFVKVNE